MCPMYDKVVSLIFRVNVRKEKDAILHTLPRSCAGYLISGKLDCAFLSRMGSVPKIQLSASMLMGRVS